MLANGALKLTADEVVGLRLAARTLERQVELGQAAAQRFRVRQLKDQRDSMNVLRYVLGQSFFLVLIGACTDRDQVAACFELQELRRFGHAEYILDDLDARAAQTQGGVLGDIRGIVSRPSGALYVLDSYWQKIVVFRPDGSVERVILGGEGEGPGEFRLPMHLTATDEGVSVVDYELQRITEFDWMGQVRRISHLNTPPPWRHVIRDDTAWVTYNSLGATSDPFVHAVSVREGESAPGPVLAMEDQAFGTGVAAGLGPAGEVLVSTARPGVWMIYENGLWSRRGTPRYPDDAPPLTEQLAPRQYRVTQAQHTASGLAAVGDSLVLQGISSLPRPFDWNDPPERGAEIFSLGVYRPDGGHLATLSLPPDVSTFYLSSDPDAGRIFLQTADPFPQAVEYRLRQCAVQP